MQNSVNERIKFLIDSLENGVASRFAKAIGVSSSVVANYLPGSDREGEPSLSVLRKIASTYERVNIEWLITGKGEPFHMEAVSSVKSIHKSGNFSESKSSGNKNNITGISTPPESSGTEIEYYRQRIKDLEDQNNKLLTQLLQLIKKE
jgi:transcriptional regulator with XRE-family HTH domain